MVDLTLAEAAAILDPPMTETQLKQLVAVAGLQPVGVRRVNPRGRPVRTYAADQLFKLHEVLVPFLTIPGA